MRRTLAAACLVLGAIAGCGAQDGASSAAAPQASPYEPVADVRQTMLWILEPAAEVIWDSSGFVITAQGETDLSPTTGAGWDRVRNSAALVAECGNLLIMPGRSMGAEWNAYARAMIAAGEQVMATAERRDAEALFDAGGALYQTCRACHGQYMVPLDQARSAE